MVALVKAYNPSRLSSTPFTGNVVCADKKAEQIKSKIKGINLFIESSCFKYRYAPEVNKYIDKFGEK